MTRLRTFIMALTLLLPVWTLYGQSVRVSGRVVDSDGEGLIGAGIQVKGVPGGAVTDLDGRYSIEVADPSAAILVYTCLGMQTQEIASEGGTTARLDGMKMVMIDTTDPASLKEENTLEIDADFSQALYNHKAILVDQARDLIAFPAEGNYLVYGYSAEQGFQLKKEITFENEWDWQSRGLYIGDFFYVVSSDCIYTIDLNTLENAGQTILSRG